MRRIFPRYGIRSTHYQEWAINCFVQTVRRQLQASQRNASANPVIDQMNHCGFAIEAKLTLEVVEDLRHPCDMPVVGKFDSVGFRVEVASPSQCRQLSAEEIALAELDSNALY
jgi:hypothetical protein